MISVVITAYNAEAFIRDSISSVLGQSEREIECVVVDDGSTDGTAAAVREVADGRVRLLEEGRVGRGRALNLGARACRGDYLAIQDADDFSHPRRLEMQHASMKGSSGWAALGARQWLVEERAKPDWLRFRIPEGPPAVRDVTASVVYRNPLSHTSLFVRREAFEKVGGYDESRWNLFDWDLLIRLAAGGFRIGRLELPLVAHRNYAGQFFERRRRWDYVRSCLSLQRAARRLLGRSRALEAVFLGLFAYRLLPAGLRIRWRRARRA